MHILMTRYNGKGEWEEIDEIHYPANMDIASAKAKMESEYTASLGQGWAFKWLQR